MTALLRTCLLALTGLALASCCSPRTVVEVELEGTTYDVRSTGIPLHFGPRDAAAPVGLREGEELLVRGVLRIGAEEKTYRVYRVVRHDRRKYRLFFQSGECETVVYAADHPPDGPLEMAGRNVETDFDWYALPLRFRDDVFRDRELEPRSADPTAPPPGTVISWFVDDEDLLAAGAPVRGEVAVDADGAWEFRVPDDLLMAVVELLRSSADLEFVVGAKGRGIDRSHQHECAVRIDRELIDDALARRMARGATGR